MENEALVNAEIKGDLAAVSNFLTQAVSPNVRKRGEQHIVLTLAMQRGWKEVFVRAQSNVNYVEIDLLSDRNAMIGAKNSITRNMTQNMEAAARAKEDVVKAITEFIIDDNIRSCNTAITLKLFPPPDILISHRITEYYENDEEDGQKELQRLRALQEELVLKFTKKGDQNPQLADKIARTNFTSHPTKSLFRNIGALDSHMLAHRFSTRATTAVVHELAKNQIPEFTPYHTSAVIEFVMERANKITRGRVNRVWMPDLTPVLASIENLIVIPREAAEAMWSEEKSYSPKGISQPHSLE